MRGRRRGCTQEWRQGGTAYRAARRCTLLCVSPHKPPPPRRSRRFLPSSSSAFYNGPGKCIYRDLSFTRVSPFSPAPPFLFSPSFSLCPSIFIRLSFDPCARPLSPFFFLSLNTALLRVKV